MEEQSYNEYGDYVVYRPNSTSEKPIYGLPVNYTVNAYPKDTYIDSINTEFQRFLDQGIKVYFTYSPRTKYALSEDSTQEERIRNLRILCIQEFICMERIIICLRKGHRSGLKK